jgi:hypothetical protein
VDDGKRELTMRLYRITHTLWKDPNWKKSFRRSWRNKAYWFHKERSENKGKRYYQFQVGAYTFKIVREGRLDG